MILSKVVPKVTKVTKVVTPVILPSARVTARTAIDRYSGALFTVFWASRGLPKEEAPARRCWRSRQQLDTACRLPACVHHSGYTTLPCTTLPRHYPALLYPACHHVLHTGFLGFLGFLGFP